MSYFPTIQGTIAKNHNDTNSYTHSITMPSSVATDEIVLVIFCADSNANYESENVSIYSSTGTWEDGPSYKSSTFMIWYYWGKTTAGGSIALTLETEALEMSIHMSMRIKPWNTCDLMGMHGWATQADDHAKITDAYSTSIDANPPGLIPDAGEQDYLWLVIAMFEGIITASAAPTDFTGFTTETTTSAENNSLAFAYRQYRYGSVYNPGVFTSTNAAWWAFTMTMYPQIAQQVLNLGISS